MPDPMAGLPPRFLRTPEAARYLGLSGRTLEKHRTYGTGPTYRKIGGRVVYAVDDLKAWADLGVKTSTSDPGKGTVLPAKKHPVLRPYDAEDLVAYPFFSLAKTKRIASINFRAGAIAIRVETVGEHGAAA